MALACKAQHMTNDKSPTSTSFSGFGSAQWGPRYAATAVKDGEEGPPQIVAATSSISLRTLLGAADTHCPAADRSCLLLGNTADALGAERGRHCV
jgi:hypothetical protein